MPRLINMADRFAKAKAAQVKSKSPTDTLKAVMDILGKNVVGKDGKECAIKIKQGFGIPFFADDTNGMKTLGTVRARLVSVSREGQPWAGTDFKVWKDDEEKQIFFMRSEDLDKPRAAKIGGRKAGAATNTKGLKEAMGMASNDANANASADNSNEANDNAGNSNTDTKVKDLT